MAGRKQILLVYAKGGPPLEYAAPRIAARGDVHLLTVRQPAPHTVGLWAGHCASVIVPPSNEIHGEDLVEYIKQTALRVRADAVMTLSEFALIAVADAARELGLRSSGPNTSLSRDKRLMRATWRQAGVPCPRFRIVSSAADLRAAYAELTPPLLVKSAWGAGAIGQRILSSPDEIETVWKEASQAVADAFDAGAMELRKEDARKDFLAEEIIHGSTKGWWPDDSGYADYLSVEGLVVNGVYHPLCIASRMPTIEPFTELSNVIPCTLPEALQRRIEETARRAVDALGLQTCGTHTEMKLMADGSLWPIESAARFGGVMIAAEIEDAFGLDPVGMLTDALLETTQEFPERMLTHRDAREAAGSLALIATDSSGNPWSRELTWDPRLVNWSTLVSPHTRIHLVPGLSITAGAPVPPYDLSRGVLGYGGVFYMRNPSADTLVRDMYAVLDGLEERLAAPLPRATGSAMPADARSQ